MEAFHKKWNIQRDLVSEKHSGINRAMNPQIKNHS